MKNILTSLFADLQASSTNIFYVSCIVYNIVLFFYNYVLKYNPVPASHIIFAGHAGANIYYYAPLPYVASKS
jgi:hypothetical protein